MMNIGQYIQQYCLENDMSMRQFAEKSGINRSYLFVLKNKTRNPGMEVIKKAARTMGMTYDELLKKIDIGLPQNLKNPETAQKILLYKAAPLTDENIIGDVAITNGENAQFAFLVSDNDMAPLIYRNATVIVMMMDSPKNDDIIIANVNGKTVCRRYVKTSSGVSLVPMNPQATTIHLDNQEKRTAAVIYGKVVEVRFTV